jgi:O-antigen/teichoic acid export membrane protein
VTSPEPSSGVVDEPAPVSRSSAVAILVGTAVMGVSGLVVLLVTAVSFEAADYALFGVFWACVFFLVTITTGVQHESTRSSMGVHEGPTTSLITFALSLSLVLFLLVAISSIWWSDAAFGAGNHRLAVLVGAGCAGYVFNCVFAGILAGAGRWWTFAALLVVEGVVRAGGMCIALLTTSSVEAAAWVVVLTYPLNLLFVLLTAGRAVSGRTRVSTTMGQLWRNTAQTMIGTAGAGALVTGFPFFMSTLSRDESSATVGALTLALMLTRAPLLVPLMGVQSMLVTAFVQRRAAPWRLLGQLLALTIGVGVVLTLVAGVLGPPVLTGVFGDDFEVRGPVLSLLVVSSAFLAAMTLVTPALIARQAFTANAGAWLLATLVSVGMLALTPWALEWRVSGALIVGPAAGLIVQLAALRPGQRVDRRVT